MVTWLKEQRAFFSQKENAYCLTLCFFVLTLYSPLIPLNNLAIAAMGLVWIISGRFKNVSGLLKNKIAFGLLVFYAFQALTLLYSSNKSVGGMWLEYRSPMAYLPLILGMSTLTSSQRNKVLLFFAWLTASASFVGLAYGSFLAWHTGDSGFLYNDNLGLLFDKQAVYFAMYINFSVAIFIWALHYNLIHKQVQRNLGVLAIVGMTLVCYLLASRIALLILVCLVLGYVCVLIVQQKKYLTGFIILSGGGILAFLSPQLFPKTMSRFVSVTNSNYAYTNMHPVDHFNGEISKENWNSLNTRLAIWSCAGEIIKRHPLTGVGIGDVGDTLLEQYRRKSFYFGIRYNLNCHNQYLDVALGGGVVGEIVFLIAVLIVPVYKGFKNRNTLLVFFVLSLAIYLITEIMFNRNQGVTFICFFMLLLGGTEESKAVATKDV
jgi:O-antigen ligase